MNTLDSTYRIRYCWLTGYFITFVIIMNSGCDTKSIENKRAQVLGKVTLDGKELQTGTIVFDPEDGTPPSSISILDGRYEGYASVGKNRIRLLATRKITMKEKTGIDGPGYDTPVEENILPPRYNEKSEIYREVMAGGRNEFNFDLKSR